MSLLSIPALPYIILQLLEHSKTSGKYKEVAMFMFQRLPAEISYHVRSRDQVSKIEDNFFVDLYTSAPRQIMISGNMGISAVWNGTQYTTGEARVDMIKQIIQSRVNQGEYTGSLTNVTTNERASQTDKTYYLNFYDFITKNFMQVNPSSMSLNRSAARNAFSTVYQLQFEESGEIVTAEQQDLMISGLLNAYKLLYGIVDSANAFLDYVLGNPMVQAASVTAELIGLTTEFVKEQKTELTKYTQELYTANPFSQMISGIRTLQTLQM